MSEPKSETPIWDSLKKATEEYAAEHKLSFADALKVVAVKCPKTHELAKEEMAALASKPRPHVKSK